jgi:hypothetical protein
MTPLRSLILAAAVLACGATPALSQDAKALPGYVDGAIFRALIDEDQEVVEVNLEGSILQHLAPKNKDGDADEDSRALFAKLKSIHAVIGKVKGSAASGMAAVQETDKKLAAHGWQRITRIKDATSTLSVLTHTAGNRIDGLVVLIFDADDKELVFANLAGEIDITRLGEIGERFNVPGLDQIPGN